MHANSRSASRGTAYAPSFVLLTVGVSIGATVIFISYRYALLGLALAGGTVLLASCGLTLWLTGRENRARFNALIAGGNEHAQARAQAEAEARRLAAEAPGVPDPQPRPVAEAPPRPPFGEVHHPRARAAMAAGRRGWPSEAGASQGSPDGPSRETLQSRPRGVWPAGGRPYPDSFDEPEPEAPPPRDALVEFRPVAATTGAGGPTGEPPGSGPMNRPPPARGPPGGVSLVDGHAYPPEAAAPLRSPLPARERRPPHAWPGQKDADAWNTFRRESPRRYERQDLSAEESRRRRAMSSRLPTVGGMLDDAQKPAKGAVPAGKTRGKCSGCATFLYAPAKRPITVVCPQCGHKAKLR